LFIVCSAHHIHHITPPRHTGERPQSTTFTTHHTHHSHHTNSWIFTNSHFLVERSPLSTTLTTLHHIIDVTATTPHHTHTTSHHPRHTGERSPLATTLAYLEVAHPGSGDSMWYEMLVRRAFDRLLSNVAATRAAASADTAEVGVWVYVLAWVCTWVFGCGSTCVHACVFCECKCLHACMCAWVRVGVLMCVYS